MEVAACLVVEVAACSAVEVAACSAVEVALQVVLVGVASVVFLVSSVGVSLGSLSNWLHASQVSYPL